MDHSRRDAEPTRPSKPTRADRRWTLLFLGNRGKTVTFHHFKAVVVTAILILLSATAVSVWFWSQNRSVRSENLGLRKEIENMKQAVASVRDEKDILTARLVVAESRVAELVEKTGPEQKPNEKQAPREKPAEKQKAALSVIEKPEPAMSVDVQNFIVFFEPDINTLRVEYKLLNTGRRGNPVSGRTMVILKEDENKPDDWLVMPAVPLVDNKPIGNRGMYFSINRFRTVRFKANDQIGPDQYKSAAVFVFSSKGTMLLEKEFPVGIQSKTLTIVEPTAQRPKESKPPSPAPEKKTPQPPPSPPPSTAAPAEAPPDEPDAYEAPASEAASPPQPDTDSRPEELIRLP
ncbi:MAG: hypothetical protein AMJ54_10390 [Deltaproteobacteria bacterium SG8_13]|nr:MAG: hypothetical protein AMJ54_10390 [Deltaproteobacteria bacterium SG8_13]